MGILESRPVHNDIPPFWRLSDPLPSRYAKRTKVTQIWTPENYERSVSQKNLRIFWLGVDCNFTIELCNWNFWFFAPSESMHLNRRESIHIDRCITERECRYFPLILQLHWIDGQLSILSEMRSCTRRKNNKN